MKLAAITAVVGLTIAMPAFAQTMAPSVPAAPATAPATAPTAKYTLDTPIETIVADPKGKAVIDADIPPLTSHPMYEQFKSMSLRGLQPISQGNLTDEILKKVEIDLAAIK
jgi:hypothetical protein